MVDNRLIKLAFLFRPKHAEMVGFYGFTASRNRGTLRLESALIAQHAKEKMQMRLPIVFAAAMASAVAGASLLTSVPTAEAYGGKCLRFRDIQSMSKLDDHTLLARTRSSQKYIVTFKHACREYGRPGNFYTVRLYGDYECFDRDDVLVFRYGGACFIESVTPAPANVPG